MTMGDRITPTRERRLEPPTTGVVATGPMPASGSGGSLPTQPEPAPVGEPIALPTT